jgi:hypothetical protein
MWKNSNSSCLVVKKKIRTLEEVPQVKSRANRGVSTKSEVNK